METKVSMGTIIRTLCLLLAIINGVLAIMGKSPLPIDDATIEEVVSFGFLAVSSLVSWWKNNSFTPEAKEADEYLYRLKKGGV